MGKTSWQIKDVLLRDRYSFFVQMQGLDIDAEGGVGGEGGRGGDRRNVCQRDLILSLKLRGKILDLHLK